MGKELVIEALRKAIECYQITADTIFHSDRGVQFTADEFRQLLNDLGITQSMSNRRNCYDNALMESFFHTLKNDLLLSGKLENRYKSGIIIFEYIEIYYNRKRLHSFFFKGADQKNITLEKFTSGRDSYLLRDSERRSIESLYIEEV